MCGHDGKYGKWDEILRDILNGKLRIVQNKKHTETETEDEDQDEDDEETPEKPERRMTHRRKMDGMLRYKQTPIMMSYKYTPMEKCLRVRILKITIDGQTETLINRIDTVVYLIKENSGYEKVVYFTGQNWS